MQKIIEFFWKCTNYGPHGKIWFDQVYQYKKNDAIFFLISTFHFLKMHKLCHVVICNWLLGKLYIVMIGSNKLYNQSIWSIPYISSMCIVLMSCLVMICNKMFSVVRLMQLMEYLITKVICNWFLVINWSHKLRFLY